MPGGVPQESPQTQKDQSLLSKKNLIVFRGILLLLIWAYFSNSKEKGAESTYFCQGPTFLEFLDRAPNPDLWKNVIGSSLVQSPSSHPQVSLKYCHFFFSNLATLKNKQINKPTIMSLVELKWLDCYGLTELKTHFNWNPTKVLICFPKDHRKLFGTFNLHYVWPAHVHYRAISIYFILL